MTTSALGAIVNDGASVSLAAVPLVQAEGHSGTTPFTFVATLTGDNSVSHSVSWSVAGSGPVPAVLSDFRGTSLPSGTIVFAPGETSKAIGVPVHGDTTVEPDEGFTITLSSPSSGLTIGVGTATATIVNDDAAVSIEAVTLPVHAEGNSGTTAFAYAVTRAGDLSVTHSVSWFVSGSGANGAVASDFSGGALPAGTVDFEIGETSKSIVVFVAGDKVVESDEDFTVTLANPSTGLAIGIASATGTIQNDDFPVAAHDDAYIVEQDHALATGTSASVLLNDDHATIATLLSGPGHGILQFNADGSFGYTPVVGFTGIDSFSYNASNGSSSADAQSLLYVAPVNVGATTTLSLLSLTAEEQIAATYVAFFARGADAAGFEFWLNEFHIGLPQQGAAALFANIASAFVPQVETVALYPFLAHPQGASDAQVSTFLDSVYNNLFNRSGDAPGLAYWTGQIQATIAAGQGIGSVLINIMSGAQNTAEGQDITTLMSKAAVGLAYVHQQEQLGTSWSFATDGANATALIHAVTSNPQTVLVGIAQAHNLVLADVH